MTKESYEFWNRVVGECEDIVSSKENELVVNLVFLEAAQKELKKFPKPKEPKNPIVK